jgi:hypothetical protein
VGAHPVGQRRDVADEDHGGDSGQDAPPDQPFGTVGVGRDGGRQLGPGERRTGDADREEHEQDREPALVVAGEVVVVGPSTYWGTM